MMVGMQDFDVDDWEKHTIYKNYAKNAKQVQWFWQVSSPQAPTYIHTCVALCVALECSEMPISKSKWHVRAFPASQFPEENERTLYLELVQFLFTVILSLVSTIVLAI